MPKNLIIYFSATGTTQEAAQQLKQLTNADLIQLEPVHEFSNDYESIVAWGKQQLDNQQHPQIKTKLPDLTTYQTVYIGFPTWWQQPPMIIHSLFDEADFKDKTIVPFTTSMSTPLADSLPYLRKMSKSSGATLAAGFRYTNKNDLKSFLLKSSSY